MQNCFVLQKKVTGVLYSCQSSQTNQSRRCIMSFTNEKQAKGFLKLMKSTQNDSKKQQEVIISKVPLRSLKRRCSMNALDLCVMDNDGDLLYMEYIDLPSDEMAFHLENVSRYY